MTLLACDVGKARLLRNALGYTAQATSMLMKLFVTTVTPADGDTWNIYSAGIASGGAYADKTLAGTAWTVASGNPATATQAAQSFTFSGSLTNTATIYGYLMLDGSDSTLLWAEKAAAGFTPTSSGDSYNVTPTITQDS